MSDDKQERERRADGARRSCLADDHARVVRELEEFLDPDVIADWLDTEQFSLGGRTPFQALCDGDLAEVLQAVNATEHGAFI